MTPEQKVARLAAMLQGMVEMLTAPDVADVAESPAAAASAHTTNPSTERSRRARAKKAGKALHGVAWEPDATLHGIQMQRDATLHGSQMQRENPLHATLLQRNAVVTSKSEAQQAVNEEVVTSIAVSSFSSSSAAAATGPVLPVQSALHATDATLHGSPQMQRHATLHATPATGGSLTESLKLSTRLGADTARRLNAVLRRIASDDTAFRAMVRDVDTMLTTDTYVVADVTSVCADDEKNPLRTWHGFVTFMGNARRRRFSLNSASPASQPTPTPPGIPGEGVPVTAPWIDDATMAAICRRRAGEYGNAWWKWCVEQAAVVRVRSWDFAADHVDDPWLPPIQLMRNPND